MGASCLYDFDIILNTGEPYPKEHLQGAVVLIVNTATQCGFARQFHGLEELWADFRDRGLVVLGFPCNQFNQQEPEDDTSMAAVCERNFGVTFPLSRKIEVNGSQADPLYVWLRQQARGVLGDSIKWNFTKFLIGRDGQVVRRYAPATSPRVLRKDIESLLG